MKRLVYQPKVEVWVKSDYGVVDLSKFVTNVRVERKVNQVSGATVQFRNPGLKFTNYADENGNLGPMFHPMDPNTIFMTRLNDNEIQVFTGYCDKTPYLQLFPGTCEITASCTLKRLLYTYWDPGLPFVWEFLANNGWQISSQFGEGIVNANAEMARAGAIEGFRSDDSGIGKLLYSVLRDVGNWPDKSIYIEALPEEIVPLVAGLFDIIKIDSKKGREDFIDMLHKIIGTATLGTGGPGPGGGGPINIPGDSPPMGAVVTKEEVVVEMLRAGFPKNATILGAGLYTMEHESGFGTTPGWDEEHDSGVLGYWQIQRSSHDVSAECCMTLSCSTEAAYQIWSDAGNCFSCLLGPNPWEGGTDSPPQAYIDFAQRVLDELASSPLPSETNDITDRPR